MPVSVRRAAFVAGIAIAASVLLGGCSGGFFGDDAGQGGGGTSGNGQSGTSGDGPVAEDPIAPDGGGTDGGAVEETDSIPADFPADIPLIDASVSVGLSMGSGWTIIFDVDDAEASYTEQSGLLLGAGFTSQGDARSSEGSAGAYDSPNYTLQMTSSTSPDPTLLVVVQSKS